MVRTFRRKPETDVTDPNTSECIQVIAILAAALAKAQIQLVNPEKS